jgi:serine/threonine protein phosphatase PrpC
MSDANPSNGGLWARLLNLRSEEPENEPTINVRPPSAPPPVAAAVPDAEVAEVAVAAVAENCPACGTPRKAGASFCDDCGWMFPAAGSTAAAPVPAVAAGEPHSLEPVMAASPVARLKDRFELGPLTNERLGVRRYQGRDLVTGQAVTIVAGPVAAPAPVAAALPIADPVDEIMPGFDDEVPMALPLEPTGSSTWPSPGWEKAILETANHPSLPRPVDFFSEGDTEYLVLEAPLGRSLWDAWYEPEAAVRYGLLVDVASALQALHQAGAMLEGLRPDLATVNEAGRAVIGDLTDLLPLPLPEQPPLRASLYTAPELIQAPATADARADLYSFGALLYTLEYLNHPLEEKDFEQPFMPKQVTERFPDVHPLFLRLINKTFVRDPAARFPTDEAARDDPTGCGELIRTLEVCKRSFDRVRLDVAAWTTTGMIRTGNEDAFAYLHGAEARQDDVHEYVMVLLCDGMGGYEAGEVAAAMAISEMRKFLLQQPMFAALAGKEPPADAVDPKAYQEVLQAALKHANREVYAAARAPGKGRRGMGCTAECVYVDGQHVFAGHVGDSRTYHLHKGRLVQLTRDQTLVNRLVELGQLSADEAENHPRKNELQQAVGGQPDVMPGTYHGRLQRGDWVLVCSDGLTNHITNSELEKMLTREASGSAEEAARRLLNLVNLRGATDNATIVVIRAS